MHTPNTEYSETGNAQRETPGEKSELLEMIAGLLRWKKPIIYFIALCTIISVIISFLLPRWYVSRASLLPPKDEGLFGGVGNISALLKDFAPVGSNRLLSQSNVYNYMAILNSRRAKEAVVKQFDLIQEYGIGDSSMENAIKKFDQNYNVGVGEDGTIQIEVFDTDRNRAAEMATYVIQVLNDISVELSTGEARSNREFLEKRIGDTRGALTAAEDKLKLYEEKNGIIVFSDEAKSSASAVSQLYARKAQLDVELAILGKKTSPDNPQFQSLRLENAELEKKLSSFPGLGMESYRLYREVVIQQKILEVLVPLYEQARIEEQKNIPVMNVLDRPVPSEKKARPQRLLIVAATFLSASIISVLIALVISRFRLAQFVHSHQFLELKNLLHWKQKT